jgi:hypothetical protein
MAASDDPPLAHFYTQEPGLLIVLLATPQPHSSSLTALAQLLFFIVGSSSWLAGDQASICTLATQELAPSSEPGLASRAQSARTQFRILIAPIALLPAPPEPILRIRTWQFARISYQRFRYGSWRSQRIVGRGGRARGSGGAKCARRRRG